MSGVDKLIEAMAAKLCRINGSSDNQMSVTLMENEMTAFAHDVVKAYEKDRSGPPRWFIALIGLMIVGVVLALLVPAIIAYVNWMV